MSKLIGCVILVLVFSGIFIIESYAIGAWLTAVVFAAALLLSGIVVFALWLISK